MLAAAKNLYNSSDTLLQKNTRTHTNKHKLIDGLWKQYLVKIYNVYERKLTK